MDPAYKKFIKDNFSGGLNKAFAAASLVGIAQADNKLKALAKTLKDMALIRITWVTALSQTLGGLGKVIKGLIRDTGSLDAALKKLSSIQQLTRSFAGLVGGMEAARKKVGELMKMSSGSGKVFSFAQWGNAAKSLQVFTRGAYSSAKAWKTIGDAAAATGNSLEDSADAIGEVYDALRNGQPIQAAAERLREMGIVTGDETDKLIKMSQSGAQAGAVFDVLTQTLERHKGGMDSLGTSVDAIIARYEKAKSALQEGVGESWVEEETKNTQNYAEALEKILPAAVALSSFFAKLTGGFSTVKSSIVKTIADSPGLVAAFDLIARGVGVLAVALTTLGLVALPAATRGMLALLAAMQADAIGLLTRFGLQAGLAGTAVKGLGMALRLVFVGGAALAGVAALAALAGAAYNFYEASKEAEKAIEEKKKAFEQETKAIEAQAKAVDTLAKKYELLKRAKDNVDNAQGELEEASAELGGGPEGDITDAFSEGGMARWWGSMKEGFAKMVAGITGGQSPEELAKQRFHAAHHAMKRAQMADAAANNIPASQFGLGPEGMSQLDMRRESKRRMEDAAFQQRMQLGSAPDQMSAIEDRIGTLSARERQAQRGLDASARMERFGKIREHFDRGTSAHAKVMAGRSTGLQKSIWEAKAKQLEEQEKSLPSIQAELAGLKTQKMELGRSSAVSSIGARLALGKQSAAASGNAKVAQGLDNFESFMQKFEELRPIFGDNAAAGMAQRFANNAIKMNATEDFLASNRSAAVSSLQAIGGGGNIGPGGGDPLLDVNKQQKELLAMAVEYLKEINAKGGGLKVKP